MEKKEFPKLMKDSTDKDGNAETMMDYVISWCLRVAQADYADRSPILHRKCRYILSKILGLEQDISKVEYTQVKVWKQSHRIDLWVEIEAQIDGKSSKYAVLIENKYYTGLHACKDTDGEYRNQLIVYKKKFKEYYVDKPEYNLKYVLITCIEREDPKFAIYDMADKYGYLTLSFYELIEDMEPTESDIYNEFWIRW